MNHIYPDGYYSIHTWYTLSYKYILANDHYFSGGILGYIIINQPVLLISQ